MKRKAAQVHRSPVVFITILTGFHRCSAIAGRHRCGGSHKPVPRDGPSSGRALRCGGLHAGAIHRPADTGCHRYAGALSAITGWLRAVGRTSARYRRWRAETGVERRPADTGCYRCTGDLRPITAGLGRA
jgi:hypothetical protein